MNRRSFIKTGIGLSLTSLVPYTFIGQNIHSISELAILKPDRLNAGDKVGLVTPAFLITEKDLKLSNERVKLSGLEPVHSDKILGKHGYFSGTDQERAEDFNSMIKNPGVKGIIIANGGYGCTRILDLIDYEAIKRNPKVIIGFSDNTALLNAIHQKTGLITFHGPIGKTIHRDYNRKQFYNIVMNPSDLYTIESTESDLRKSTDNKTFERYVITPGNPKGKLTGGNLTLICSMVGTPYQIDMEDKIVMIEDTGEEPYRMDRMLTQLISSDLLTRAAGIAFGICRDCDISEKTNAPNSFTLREVIEDRIKPLGIPAVYGLSFGHNENNFTFPIGLNARLDTDNMTVTLLEKAVK